MVRGLARWAAPWNLVQRDQLAMHVVLHFWLVVLHERGHSSSLRWHSTRLIEELLGVLIGVVDRYCAHFNGLHIGRSYDAER